MRTRNGDESWKRQAVFPARHRPANIVWVKIFTNFPYRSAERWVVFTPYARGSGQSIENVCDVKSHRVSCVPAPKRGLTWLAGFNILTFAIAGTITIEEKKCRREHELLSASWRVRGHISRSAVYCRHRPPGTSAGAAVRFRHSRCASAIEHLGTIIYWFRRVQLIPMLKKPPAHEMCSGCDPASQYAAQRQCGKRERAIDT
ncbi:hypothetical protein ZHAS_00011136 [Anopheles sinensis]|uniref:Uncharacterized protein n=1 Tax=Anopheles sinensis TaxID=74873 RepID=A0A084VZE9_ANOSI|nr:hypothetical protein ZHAS_00011136 [Anopheles sinensis]